MENAEQLCEEALNKAIQIYPCCEDALLAMSNLRILRDRDEEAINCLTIILNRINDEKNEEVYNNSFLRQLCRMLLEVNKYKDSIQIAKKGLIQDEEDVS